MLSIGEVFEDRLAGLEAWEEGWWCDIAEEASLMRRKKKMAR